MVAVATSRRWSACLLMLAIACWAEAGLALVPGDQVLQCSMSVHEMATSGEMPCCPLEAPDAVAAMANHAPCCSLTNPPERPIGFVISPKQVKSSQPDAVAVAPATLTAEVGNYRELWRSADAPRFVKPVLELKTDLRI